MLRAIQKRIFPDPGKGDWQSWRETILAHCLFLGSILIFACLVPSILLLTYEKKFLLLWFSCAAFACFMGMFWLKRLSYGLRAYSV